MLSNVRPLVFRLGNIATTWTKFLPQGKKMEAPNVGQVETMVLPTVHGSAA